ncbi:MAG: choice-of-anchor D domain-containing protein, partial [Methylococcaceae bacterium]|nr:choice-of-anchor D domain-containing protein [Methylococcaceae bacterium]
MTQKPEIFPLLAFGLACGLAAGSVGATQIVDGSFADHGPGELFLSVYDGTNGRSGTVNLAVTYDAFVAGYPGNSWDLSGFLKDLNYTASDSLTYNIFAAKTYVGVGTAVAPNTDYGMLVSRLTGDQVPNKALTNNNVVALTNKVQLRIQEVNGNLAPLGTWTGDHEISATADLQSHWATNTGVLPWMTGVEGNQVYFYTDAQVGSGHNETLDIYWLHVGDSGITRDNVMTGTAGQDKLTGTFTLDPAAGTLTYSGGGGGGTANPVLSAIDDFAEQTVGSTSAAKTVTLSNSGTAGYFIKSIATGSAEFSVTGNCSDVVAANGGSCQIQVSFAPTAVGVRTATLTVKPVSGADLTLALKGTGAAPVAKVAFGALDAFAEQAIGTTSSAKTVKLSNTGGVAYAIQSIAASGEFAVASHTCGASLAAASDCEISLTFTPVLAGSRKGILTVTPASGSPLTLDLGGTGANGASVLISPPRLDFGIVALGKKAGLTVTVTNVSSGSLDGVSLSAPEAPFTKLADHCSGKKLKPGKSCDVQFQFKPGEENSFSGSSFVSAAGQDAGAISLAGGAGSSATFAVDSLPDQDIGLSGRFVVTGQAFTSRHGKVLVGGKAAKILTWTDSLIVAKAPKLTKNSYGVEVVAKGSKATGTPQFNVVVHGPEVDAAATPTSGAKGSAFTIAGHYFGEKKPPVRFQPATGGRAVAGKVQKGGTDREVTVLIPARLTAGDYAVTVSNFA